MAIDLPPYDVLLAQGRAVAAQVSPATPAAAAVDPGTLAWRNAALVGGGAIGVGLYGAVKWWDEGFGGGFKTQSEGWFGKDTQYGGVDKIGHAYSAHVGVRLLTPLLEAVGNDHDSAARIAAWSSWGVLSAVEVIDGYSKQYKFSREDFLANTAGALMAYAFEHNPRIDAALDFRLSYRQSSHSSDWDPAGDYSGQRFLLVGKLEAVPALADHPLARYVELMVGYGTRGYDADPPGSAPKSRDVYFGVGINLARVLADAFYGGARSSTRAQRIAERTLDLIQFPTAAYYRKELDP
jgi:hypothetical protein